MNLAQAKIQLEKIISLYKSISADGQVSALERDLMLGYIRHLYETFLDGQPSPIVNTPLVEKRLPEPPRQAAVPPTPQPPMQQPRVTVVAEPQPTPVVETPKPAPPPPPPVVETPKPAPPPLPPPPPVVETPKPRPSTPSVSGKIPSEILALFDDVAGKELSDRLSNTAIADLTKAFGINDRLLTINELFGGNKPAFDEATKDLNNASGFDAARDMMLDIAVRNNWVGSFDRQTVAKSFIKLVRRRFK